MKKISFFITMLAVMTAPSLTHAADLLLGGGTGGDLATAMTSFLEFLNGVLVPFLLAIGFFMFVWGIIKYFVIGGDNDDAKASGKSLIIYAISGFVVILAFWGIVNIIVNGVGLKDQSLTDTPTINITPS